MNMCFNKDKMMKYTHRMVLFFMIAFLLSSCRYQDREVYLDFQENPQAWMPDESTQEMIYSDSLGHTLDYTLDYIDNRTGLVGIESEEGEGSYYFGTWKSLRYFDTGGEKPRVEYEYYIKFKEYTQVDMLRLYFGDFFLDMAIPDQPDQPSNGNVFNYNAYSNYLFADTLLLN